MSWPTILIQVVPLVIELVQLAEKAFADQPKSGAAKKALVLKVAKSVIAGLLATSTGGQKETWKKLAGPLNMIIDIVVGFLFPHEEEE